MNFEESLRYELSIVPSLTNKVYPLNAPEGIIEPFLIYISSEGVREKDLTGFSTMRDVSCEIQVVSTTYADLKTLVQQVINQVLTFQGRAIGIDGVFIKDLEYDAPVELHDEELKQYRSVFDIRVKY